MNISVQDLKSKIDNKEEVVLVDVRESYEHEEFNIGGTLVPVGDLMSNIDKLPKNKEDEIIVYCRSGNRSGMAQQLMKGFGYKNVLNLTGGMLAWKENEK